MRNSTLIGGRPLLGFAALFDAAWGKPTAEPLPTVTPSCMAGVLLPFRCPHCDAVRPEVVDPKTRAGWQDRRREFSWCPACQGRYVIDFKGMPLANALPAGAECAPARVERDGKTEMLPGQKEPLALLGAAKPKTA